MLRRESDLALVDHADDAMTTPIVIE
jgi:hypothetical protein